MSLANRLRSAREKKGFSQKHVASLLGIRNARVSTWETGIAEPSSDMLEQLANIYEVTVDYLVTGRPANATPQDVLELNNVLEESSLMFHGVPLSDADRAQIKRVLEGLFWESLEKKRNSEQE